VAEEAAGEPPASARAREKIRMSIGKVVECCIFEIFFSSLDSMDFRSVMVGDL
jgi:hypothetical protein